MGINQVTESLQNTIESFYPVHGGINYFFVLSARYFSHLFFKTSPMSSILDMPSLSQYISVCL